MWFNKNKNKDTKLTTMENIKEILSLLPLYHELQDILSKHSLANYVIPMALRAVKEASENIDEVDLEESTYMIQALQDKLWETIHTGHFSEIPIEIRKIYGITCLLKIFLLLLENGNDIEQIDKCNQVLDDALLLGYPQQIYQNYDILKIKLMELFDQKLNDYRKDEMPIINVDQRREITCDIQQLDQPSLEIFKKRCFDTHQPALLLHTLKEWPALRLWCDLNYILKLGGNRTVPVEIGSHYATEEWSQQLMTLRKFLTKQFADTTVDCSEKHTVHYLAQHDLFEQIPSLKKDFSIPDYCYLGAGTKEVDIKAWLGPKGTISPLHYDPKHNCLCQIFGSKEIILAAPEHSQYLYPHVSEFLQNTSQVNAEMPDFEKFPLVKNVKFLHLTLQPGDCLYLPPKWWHYVKSLSPSFSISFWWT